MAVSDLFAAVTSGSLNERSTRELMREAAAQAFGSDIDENGIGLFVLTLSGSLDALAPLLERYRPDVRWTVEREGDGYVARVPCHRGDNPAKARTPGRALLLSYLRSIRADAGATH